MLRPGFLLDKKIGVNQPKRMENVNILIANTGMDTDKIKVNSHTHTHTHTHTHPVPVLLYINCVCVCVSDLWLKGSRRLDGEGCRDRTRREREDEGEGRPNPETRNQLLHQQVHTHTHTHIYTQLLTHSGLFKFFCKTTKLPLLVCYRQLIYNYPEQLFAQAGVMAIEHADFAGVERLALVTGTYKPAHTHSAGSIFFRCFLGCRLQTISSLAVVV